jgi:hypothetical protein
LVFSGRVGKAWMKEVGITQAQMEEMQKKGMGAMWKSYALAFVSAVATAFVLGSMIAFNGLTDV